jgi:hypothetical protein
VQEKADINQLRHQAKDLLRTARAGDASALMRILAVETRLTLGSAQLAIARENGFPSWAKMKAEFERIQADDRDLEIDEGEDSDWADDTDLPGFRGWTDQGTPIQEI